MKRARRGRDFAHSGVKIPQYNQTQKLPLVPSVYWKDYYFQMKWYFLSLILLLPWCLHAQSDQHYTMFMYNKLLYNPAYAGSRDVTSVNGVYRGTMDGDIRGTQDPQSIG